MDFPLSSSVILVIAVALWIVWVAPYMLRNSRQFRPAGDFLMDAADVEKADPQAGYVVTMASPQEKPMTSTQRPDSAPAGPATAAGPKPAPYGGAFRIRYGRLSLALLGVLFLLTGVVSGVLRLFGLGSGWLPALTLLGVVAVVALLRTLAVRDRRRKVNAAFRSAMGAPARHEPPMPADRPIAAAAPGPAKESPLFDAEAGTGAVPVRPQPLTAEQLRQAALAEAAASGDPSVRRVGDPASAEGASWEPVEVPKPTYVEAPKAERAAPEPLDLPEAPKAAGKPSLKQAGARPAEPAAETKPQGKGQSALSNLDDVLQRRRA